MRFPYGIADFRKIWEEGYFYVDRTDRIPLLEETGSQLLFLRPRRFGKSLWLSTLENYFKAVKEGAEGRGLDRVFLTGVSPVVLSDITSGYNVAKDITHLDEYHDLCGFTAEELAEALIPCSTTSAC